MLHGSVWQSQCDTVSSPCHAQALNPLMSSIACKAGLQTKSDLQLPTASWAGQTILENIGKMEEEGKGMADIYDFKALRETYRTFGTSLRNNSVRLWIQFEGSGASKERLF